jgi:hypothetical protein
MRLGLVAPSSPSPVSVGGGRSEEMQGMDAGPWTGLGTLPGSSAFGW